MSSRRFYRESLGSSDLFDFKVNIKETDLWVAVDRESFREELKGSLEKIIWKHRLQLENYIKENPGFKETLEPYLIENAPLIVHRMVKAGNTARVGPMAAVAGVFAEIAGKHLLQQGVKEVIVENGGDIFLYSRHTRVISIYAGDSPLSGKTGLKISPQQTPLGICTSSGVLGPSYSKGKADAVVVLSPSVPLADAAATALGNEIKSKKDLPVTIENCRDIEGVTGILIICEDELAAWGEIQLCRLSATEKENQNKIKGAGNENHNL